MIFVETRPFSRRRAEQLSDEQFRLLQRALILNPDAGKLIPGAGGLRKLRWGSEGRGKRGGVRLIYYSVPARELILLLFLYPKNEQNDLTPDQVRTLSALVKSELRDLRGKP